MTISFTGINYAPCTYCRSIVAAPDGHGDETYGCKANMRDGKYARLTYDVKVITSLTSKEALAINKSKGCNKFSPSGIPAHPQVIDRLIAANPLTASVPVNQNAMETSNELEDKVEKHLMNRVHSNLIW